jgi:putative PIN family toxin of toxin-antitoxin system
MSSATPRAVYDCNVFLQAVLNKDGPAFACLSLVEAGQITLVLSTEVLAEVKDVLNRPKLRNKLPNLTPERVNELLEYIEGRSLIVPTVPRVFTLDRDPKDEIYVNLAIEAGANFLVSRDKDLLDLMSDPAYRSQFPGLTILDPVAFLKELSAKSEPGGSETPGAEEPLK